MFSSIFALGIVSPKMDLFANSFNYTIVLSFRHASTSRIFLINIKIDESFVRNLPITHKFRKRVSFEVVVGCNGDNSIYISNDVSKCISIF